MVSSRDDVQEWNGAMMRSPDLTADDLRRFISNQQLRHEQSMRYLHELLAYIEKADQGADFVAPERKS
jgi:hypothetical protein